MLVPQIAKDASGNLHLKQRGNKLIREKSQILFNLNMHRIYTMLQIILIFLQ